MAAGVVTVLVLIRLIIVAYCLGVKPVTSGGGGGGGFPLKPSLLSPSTISPGKLYRSISLVMLLRSEGVEVDSR